MAQTRTYDPEGPDELARLVREAIGDGLRPPIPGAEPSADVAEDEEPDDGPTLIDLPHFSF